MASSYDGFKQLSAAIDNTPLIDNHAHPLLTRQSVSQHPLLSVASEATGSALEDSRTSLAHFLAVKHLADALGCEETWDAVAASIAQKQLTSDSWEAWVKRCLDGIETILLDDGLTVPNKIEHYSWHDAFTRSKCKRIVRLETLAGDIIALEALQNSEMSPTQHLARVIQELTGQVTAFLHDPEVVAFKSIICYRRGLDILTPEHVDLAAAEDSLKQIIDAGNHDERPASNFSLKKRLENSPLNDLIVLTAATAIRDFPGHKKPIQFHTGLGDNDINLTKSSPAHLQPFIRYFPDIPVVLLHAGYPWTRETAYLAAMYPNVYADIGEVFLFLSQEGQEGVLKQILELCPWSKVLCSTDGNCSPETYLIGTAQIRSVLKAVLGKAVQSGQLDEKQAVQLVQDVLFNNSKKLYNLDSVRSTLPSFAELGSDPLPGSSNQEIVSKLRRLGAKYLRVYWNDYTSSVKCRVIPIKHVYKTLASGKPLTLSVTKSSLGLLQIDVMIPQITATGAYTLHIDWLSLKLGPADGHVSCYANFAESDGSESVLCPRTILRKQADGAAVHGLTFLLGFEIEFVVLERNPDPTSVDKYSTLRNDGHAWSMARALADWGREGSFATAADEILDSLDAAGIAVEQFHAESAPGQYEIVLPALPPLEACDTLLHARQILESVAARHGFRITLHPKPFAGACGTASHLHLSVSSSSSSPSSSSPAVYESFYAGILSHLDAILAFTYSNPTSYERMVDSGWAGGRWVTWGTQNKEAPLRKVEGAHWEFKTIDGLANPYLAAAAILAAGTAGILGSVQLTWGDCADDPALLSDQERAALGITTQLPEDLRAALAALERDAPRLGFDAAFVRRYVDVKEAELRLLEPMGAEERRRWVLERY
ncbi:glutamine synthetase/guanido kinase [Durotheca rogersii]|uniref:glutamine synthetase/guanido kinase n=1 Tax=Durotheca rogersii TaxID=419775 RepID=UPI00221FF1A4|nr:glutamine synthetase/guanido kinase [Durotheca rogersii]KAI5860284.1 glutamine synthetase/guanido kinase [Durotheca rogersii]